MLLVHSEQPEGQSMQIELAISKNYAEEQTGISLEML